MERDIHVVSMDVEAIAVIKKNSKKIIIRKDVSRQWRSYRSTSFLCYFTDYFHIEYFLLAESNEWNVS